MQTSFHSSLSSAVRCCSNEKYVSCYCCQGATIPTDCKCTKHQANTPDVRSFRRISTIEGLSTFNDCRFQRQKYYDYTTSCSACWSHDKLRKRGPQIDRFGRSHWPTSTVPPFPVDRCTIRSLPFPLRSTLSVADETLSIGQGPPPPPFDRSDCRKKCVTFSGIDQFDAF